MEKPESEDVSTGIAETLEEAAKHTGNKKKKAKQKDNSEIIKLKEEITSLTDRVLRASAETENVRKRMEKQVEDAGKYAVSNFAKDLVNVMENLHRAINNINPKQAEEDPLLKTVLDGVLMTEKELSSAFEKHRIIRIQPEVGEMFNHEMHQAVTQVPTPDAKEGSVVNVIQAGYMISDRLLRPAMVAVAKIQ